MELNNLEERIKMLSEYHHDITVQVHSILIGIAKKMKTNDILFNMRVIWPTLIGNRESEIVTFTMMHIRERVAPDDLSDIEFYTSDGDKLIIDDFFPCPAYFLKLIDAIKTTGKSAIDSEDITIDTLTTLSKNFLANIPETFIKFIDIFSKHDMFEYAEAWSELFKAVKRINALDSHVDKQPIDDANS